MYIQTSANRVVQARPPKGRVHATPVFSRGLAWITILLAAICFEGLGRKFMLQVPSMAFYLAKDAVLLSAVFLIGIKSDVVAVTRVLYGRFSIFLGLAILWTLLQLFNPDQGSLLLGALGIRSYWLWWCAPILIASTLRGAEQRNRAAIVLAAFAIFIGFYATLQYAAPPEADINQNARYDGALTMPVNTVAQTGKARVSSTFSFLTGFTGFATAGPIILLAVGLDGPLSVRIATITGTVIVAGTAAMAGSRGGLVLCGLGLLVLLFRAGFIRGRTRWWVLTAIAVAATFAYYRAGESVEGVVSRFEGTDTPDRIEEQFAILPPIALAQSFYPLLGIGTGMQQNARFQLGIPGDPAYMPEGEPGRLLVELGPFGYGLFWTARLGVLIALLRASRILKRTGQIGASGGAAALAALTMFNNLVFDHVWQALFFTSVGIILSATVDAAHKLQPVAPSLVAPNRAPTRP
jgi:hypothetical protein